MHPGLQGQGVLPNIVGLQPDEICIWRRFRFYQSILFLQAKSFSSERTHNIVGATLTVPFVDRTHVCSVGQTSKAYFFFGAVRLLVYSMGWVQHPTYGVAIFSERFLAANYIHARYSVM